MNNRDLKTFTTDLATTERLAELATEDALLVGESGIATHEDCQRLAKSGVRSFLVGESLMRQDDVAAATPGGVPAASATAAAGAPGAYIGRSLWVSVMPSSSRACASLASCSSY